MWTRKGGNSVRSLMARVNGGKKFPKKESGVSIGVPFEV